MRSSSRVERGGTRKNRTAGAVVLLLVLAGCETSLRDELSESQADEVVALLRQEGIESKKVRSTSGTWSVTVDKGAEADGLRLARLYGAPRTPHATIAEIFPGSGLLPSELEEHARYEFALGHELARTIENIDGVLSARVHVAVPVQNPRKKERQPPSASVFVRHRSDQRIDMMKNQIRTLVAQALPGGNAEAVSVMSVPVFPPAEGTGRTRTLLGVRYRAENSTWPALLLVLPWVLLSATVGYVGWRAGAHRAVLAWLATSRHVLSEKRGAVRRRRRA